MRQLFVRRYTAAVCSSLIVLVALHGYAGEKVPVISKEELKGMLDDPGVIVIDVRVDGAWKSSSQKIKGAVREDFYEVKAWAGKYPRDKMIVLYCS